jgi:hypothetical protein
MATQAYVNSNIRLGSFCLVGWASKTNQTQRPTKMHKRNIRTMASTADGMPMKGCWYQMTSAFTQLQGHADKRYLSLIAWAA